MSEANCIRPRVYLYLDALLNNSKAKHRLDSKDSRSNLLTKMNKITVLILLLALATLQIDAKKAKKHELQKETKKESEGKDEPKEEPEVKGFFPGFAIRIPVPNFGILTNMREHLDNLFSGKQPVSLNDFVPGDKSKLKTTTKVKNSTHGPYKTYTVTSETVSTENKTAPRVVSKIFKSLTTMDKNKLPKGKDGKIKMPSMEFELGPLGPVFTDDVAGDKCSTPADCKGGTYCDAFYKVCKKLLDPGATCTQKEQCDSKDGKYRCTWGRCISNSEEGSQGTFCDTDSECHSKEELSCQEQADISRFSGVCMAKLDEGATCGNAIRSMFDLGLFKRSAEPSNVCKRGLTCRTVGFFGRKVCIKDSPEYISEEPKSIEDQTSNQKTETSKEKKEDKSKKLKF